MLDLALLLRSENIDPCDVLVMRHRPSERSLRDIIGWLAAEEPATFNGYQSTHGPTTEAALKRARWLASFIGHEPGKALFVGLYEVAGNKPISASDNLMRPEHQRLMTLGMNSQGDLTREMLLFDLHLSETMSLWKARLVIDWPKPDRSWFRWADPKRNVFPVRALSEESMLAEAMPDWQELSLSWQALSVLPTSWRQNLSQWRGIYLIFDASDGKSYVGSAAGQDNILGRWLHYASTGHGGNALLRTRDPANFHFSILQRVSPDLPVDEIVALEQSWKSRLHTAAPSGLNSN